MASNIDFPIFISSTHYDLVDLRAELSAFLDNLGYRPVLSSEEGFPDSPNLPGCFSKIPSRIDTLVCAFALLDQRHLRLLP